LRAPSAVTADYSCTLVIAGSQQINDIEILYYSNVRVLPGLSYQRLRNYPACFIAVRVSDTRMGMASFKRDIDMAVGAVEFRSPTKKLQDQFGALTDNEVNYARIA
jgi:hypothetical protein